MSGDKSRPLLGDQDAMRELLERRRGAYAEADYVVETGERAAEQLAIEIAELLDK